MLLKMTLTNMHSELPLPEKHMSWVINDEHVKSIHMFIIPYCLYSQLPATIDITVLLWSNSVFVYYHNLSLLSAIY